MGCVLIQQPTVTIGVPVHNGAKLLHNCLESLRTQTFTNFNVIIFENRSTDTSLEIAQSFVDIDDRFSICPSDTFLDCADNFRRAIQKCSTDSEYFLLRAHDDITNPEYIQVLVDALGPVEIHRVRMIVAPMWIMASKLISVLHARIAIRLNSLSF